VFAYGVYGDLRFISHHDTLQMFRRALSRAALPVRFTEGFNPHPKLSIPLPLPVGVASEAESIVVEFERPIDGETALRELQYQMPPNVKMTGARRLEPGERLHPALVRYRLDLRDRPGADVESRIRKVSESATTPVERVDPKNGHRRTVDVRPYLADIRIDGNVIEFTLRVTGGGTAKPAEIAGLLGFDPGSINHRIQRLEIQWE